MNTPIKLAAYLSIAVLLGISSAGAAGLAGTVRDANHRALSGATIRIEAAGQTMTTTTDDHGRYAQATVPSGKLRVSLVLNGDTKAVINNVSPRQNETEILNFDLKRGPSAAGKHYVLLKDSTGTHIDRWVEVTQTPAQMSLGMQERMNSSPSQVVRQIQDNAGFVRR
jgi:hypothetical protein